MTTDININITREDLRPVLNDALNQAFDKANVSPTKDLTPHFNGIGVQKTTKCDEVLMRMSVDFGENQRITELCIQTLHNGILMNWSSLGDELIKTKPDGIYHTNEGTSSKRVAKFVASNNKCLFGLLVAEFFKRGMESHEDSLLPRLQEILKRKDVVEYSTKKKIYLLSDKSTDPDYSNIYNLRVLHLEDEAFQENKIELCKSLDFFL